MPNKVIVNNTATSGRVPTPTEIQDGELVLNYQDKALYYKTAEGLIDSFSSDSRLQPSIGAFTWNSSTASPAALDYYSGIKFVTKTHLGMRRCVVNDSGVVQYYLDPTNSALKESGAASVLTGDDGQVMVEVPKFYTNRTVNGPYVTWSISDLPVQGYTVHPAFVKDGVEVNYRYYGAYDACYWDATDSTYKSGLNLDDLTASLDLAADKLASVSGVYPICGVTRAECRTLAANRGAFWRQLDFALFSAVQLLYLIENQSFYSQNILGAGNTNGSYVANSSNQNDSPSTVAGSSNWLGNGTTNTVSGAGVSAKPGTSYMCYRGIENFYGNCWQWVDGINVNVGTNGYVYVTNNRADFADNTSTNMTLISTTAPTTSGYQSAFASINNYFVASGVSGSSSTYMTDYWYGSTSSNRVVLVGGGADNGASAGAFGVSADNDSGTSARSVGARLAG